MGSDTLSRRNFLFSAAVGASGVAAASLVGCSAATSSASAGAKTSTTDKAAKTEVALKNDIRHIGPYSQVLRANGFIWFSGQIPLDPGTGQIAGADVNTQIAQIFKNIEAELADAGATLDNVVKVTVYLADMDDFSIMNEEYAKHFNEPYPVRSCIQAVRLPIEGARVLIDAISIDPSAQ